MLKFNFNYTWVLESTGIKSYTYILLQKYFKPEDDWCQIKIWITSIMLHFIAFEKSLVKNIMDI